RGELKESTNRLKLHILSITANVVPLVDSPQLAVGFQPGVGECPTTDLSARGISVGSHVVGA
ncbi:MAG: hypothetical protein AAF808_17480, partial [Cyanobacteria bacterium P01_D01_bin.2]